MTDHTPAWWAITGVGAACIAVLLGAYSPAAVADPMQPPVPAPVTVTQTVTVAPLAGTSVAPVPVASGPAAVSPAYAPATAPGATPVISAALGAGAPTVTQPGAPAAPPAPPALVPATSGTLRDYFAGKHVVLEPQHSGGFSALSITLPMPPGWSAIPDPNVPDAFAVTANRSSPDLYTPNAQLVVYKLVGDFDPKEAITHGLVDTQALSAWQTTDASLAEFGGFPSAAIEGSYRENSMVLNTSRRHVIATTPAGHYLVSLSVTTQGTSQAAPVGADATDAILNGFRVAVPGPAPARPAS